MVFKKIDNYFLDYKLISKDKINFWILLNISLFALVLIFFHFTSYDIELQKLFYVHENGWILDRNNQDLKMIFYILPKKVITFFCGIIILFNIFSFIFCKNNYTPPVTRKVFLYILLSVMISILSVTVLKQLTNMYCPDALSQFGGYKKYVKLFENYTPSLFEKRGKCFPAGHASAGFSFICLSLILVKKSHKLIAFLTFFILGWIMGSYQVMKGAHYLSDTIITMLISLLSALICYKLILLNTESKKESL